MFEPLEAGGVQCRQASALAPDTVVSITEQVRRHLRRWFSRHGLLDADDARDLLAGANGGFSRDAAVGESPTAIRVRLRPAGAVVLVAT